ncbi:MAG: hypothetical protein Q4B85_12615 [Lachnospiraceae bacterium]|nr:hypothetical protein [Lachnospiraceae bacterium]
MKNNTKTEPVRLLSIPGLCTFLSMGKNKAVEFGKLCGAELHIGRRCLYDRAVIEAVLDDPREFERVIASMSEE